MDNNSLTTATIETMLALWDKGASLGLPIVDRDEKIFNKLQFYEKNRNIVCERYRNEKYRNE